MRARARSVLARRAKARLFFERRRPPPPPRARARAARLAPRAGHDEGSCKLYKRTMTSRNAYADAAFLRDYLGLDLQGNFTYHTDRDHRCAERQLMESLDAWGVHIFESTVSAEGNVSVSEWVDDWVDVKKGFGKRYEWDAWMAQSAT